jgi:hypothetical protein
MPSTSAPDNEPKYQWLDQWVRRYLDGAVTLSLTGINSPGRFLELVGAAQPFRHDLRGVPALADESTPDAVLVGATPAPGKEGWVLGAESPADVGYDNAAGLSIPGTMAVAFSCNMNGAWFTWAEGGENLVAFSLTEGVALSGSNPQRLAEIMDQAGLDPGNTTHPCATATALLEAITGVAITRQMLAEGEFTSGTVKFPYW